MAEKRSRGRSAIPSITHLDTDTLVPPANDTAPIKSNDPSSSSAPATSSSNQEEHPEPTPPFEPEPAPTGRGGRKKGSTTEAPSKNDLDSNCAEHGRNITTLSFRVLAMDEAISSLRN
ncbi:hypothetical protein VNI00_005504 [Paramarasmius palmivorus]|uniref:Uncharacterized protein n=1 Tax=Paramarasmius palmivorus TaxID=297713 RepID=A0AAW0DDJ5_9AGAR